MTTVGELLALDPAAVNTAFIDAGSEPAFSRPKRPARGPPRSAVALDHFVDDARAGATDVQIARAARASEPQVRRWRLGLGITRKAGRPSTMQRLSRLALDVFATEYVPVPHEVRSPVDGEWDCPEYVLRTPLSYEAFARAVLALADAGFDPATITGAVGVRERDVAHALALANARLR